MEDEGALQKGVMVIQARKRYGFKKQAHEMRGGLGPESGDMRCGWSGSEERGDRKTRIQSNMQIMKQRALREKTKKLTEQ